MNKLDVKLISVKTYGRSHLACLKCRSQKIKCSGTLPTCRNCLASNKECKYPKRDRKITLLESQLEKLNNKIKYLEDKLAKVEHSRSPSERRDSSGSERNLVRVSDEKDTTEDSGDDNDAVEDDNEAIISLNSGTNITNNSKYFGTSSAQVFDSALKLHLCEIGSSSAVGPKPRFAFKDPTLMNSFPGAVLLPDKTYALSLVKKVISFIGHEYYLFDTCKFYNDIDAAYENPAKMNPLWICYFLITLAVGEQYLNYSLSGEIPGIGFYTSAMNLYKPSYEEPTLESVQMLLLIAFYLQGLNSANAAFTFYGLASRAALIQGLHRKIDSMGPEEREKRKRVWWSVFVMESIWCSNLGHPIHVHVKDIDIELPCENVHDLRDEFNSSVLEHNVKLAMIMGSVMSHVYIPSKGATSVKFAKMLGSLEELEQFHKKIPEMIKNDLLLSHNRSSANLYLRLNHDIIVTTRPLLLSLFKGHVQPSEVVKTVVLRCLNSAMLNIDILSHLKSTDWLSTFGFWDAQFCFTSLMILIICSWSGNVYPQTEVGGTLHRYMKEAGNFTARDNDSRLAELDELLLKIPKSQRVFGTAAVPRSGSNPVTMTATTTTRAGAEQLVPEDVLVDTGVKLSDIVLKSPNGDYEQIGDFSLFRNNFSPDTWNELTGNDCLWDPFSTS